MRHFVYQCGVEECRFRFPLAEGPEPPAGCPRCGGGLLPAEGPFAGRPVRAGVRSGDGNDDGGGGGGGDTPGAPTGPALEVLLDNIRSLYNVGSMFRTADGAGVTRLHLCGQTATPDNPRLAKTALGADRVVPWTHAPNGLDRARELLAAGRRLWALEGGDDAVPLAEAGPPPAGLVLVVGNEVCGVDPAILDLCERRVCLPMRGLKGSLNAAVAFGVALYALRFR